MVLWSLAPEGVSAPVSDREVLQRISRVCIVAEEYSPWGQSLERRLVFASLMVVAVQAVVDKKIDHLGTRSQCAQGGNAVIDDELKKRTQRHRDEPPGRWVNINSNKAAPAARELIALKRREKYGRPEAVMDT